MPTGKKLPNKIKLRINILLENMTLKDYLFSERFIMITFESVLPQKTQHYVITASMDHITKTPFNKDY